jgi:hypothetical protein
MILLEYFLCLLSPGPAIGFAAWSYLQHCKDRPDPQRRIPGLAYALVVLVFAIGGFFFGMIRGIDWACSEPAGNLCGLTGVFVSGPLAAALAISFIGGLILLLPSDRTSESP